MLTFEYHLAISREVWNKDKLLLACLREACNGVILRLH